jgi:hypothetical protein
VHFRPRSLRDRLPSATRSLPFTDLQQYIQITSFHSLLSSAANLLISSSLPVALPSHFQKPFPNRTKSNFENVFELISSRRSTLTGLSLSEAVLCLSFAASTSSDSTFVGLIDLTNCLFRSFFVVCLRLIHCPSTTVHPSICDAFLRLNRKHFHDLFLVR